MKNIETILFALDISDHADETFEYAATLAVKLGSDVAVIHVIQEQNDLRAYYVPHISFDDIDTEIEKAALEHTEKFCEKHGVQTSFVEKGIPSEKIIEKAKEINASMIVMGTHGRQGFEHFIFGSTAEDVIKNAPCPVLTVRPKGGAEA
jgi:nucleotide-binding universal stress UspA family protein